MEILAIFIVVAVFAPFVWLAKKARDNRVQREQAQQRELDLLRRDEEIALLKRAVGLEGNEQRTRRSTGADISRPKFISASDYIPEEESLRERPAERSPGAHGNAKWIAPGETVTVQKIKISAGMFYLGSTLYSRRGQVENCLINPMSSISPKHGDKAGTSMGYYPSYTLVTPSARRAYLEWLADGRRDTDVGIGHVFLFFYGLERRVFIDRALGELPTIREEVQRLLSIYGSNRSFSRYANTFLDISSLLLEDPPPPELKARKGKGSNEIPLAVRRHLGSRLADHGSLDADGALLWVFSVPDTTLKAFVERYFDEFVDIWRARFDLRFPKGLQVDAPTRRLVAEYAAASNSFRVPVAAASGPIPDIAGVSKSLKSLRGLLETCTKDLQPYHDHVRSKPHLRDTLGAIMLLPKPVLDRSRKDIVDPVRRHLDSLFGERGNVLVPVRTVFSLLGLQKESSEKISALEAQQIAICLDNLDVGFEPDRRYGPSTLAPDARVVLFKAADGAPVDAYRIEYRAARAMVEVSALIALKDGRPTPEEFERIQDELRRRDGLSSNAQHRLQAHALALLNNAPQQRAVLKRLLDLPEANRIQIVHAAMAVALVDGQVSRHEVTFLEDLHKALNLPQEEVYAAIHRLQSGDAPPKPGIRTTLADVPAEGQAPTTVVDHQAVREAQRRTKEARQEARRSVEMDARTTRLSPSGREGVDRPVSPALPASELVSKPSIARPEEDLAPPRRSQRPAPAVAHSEIDEEKLARIEAETAVVSSLLAGIFAADEESEPVVVEEPAGDSRFEGLDTAHSELLAWILENDSVTREAFEGEASKYKLLPDGAIEAINEWGVETIGEVILDGDDVIMIDEDIRDELRKLEAE